MITRYVGGKNCLNALPRRPQRLLYEETEFGWKLSLTRVRLGRPS